MTARRLGIILIPITLLVTALCGAVHSGGVPAGQAAAAAAAVQTLDFEFFKTRVEPIFLKKRPTHARCYVCHAESGTGFRLERLTPGSTFWTEEQSRRNFQSVSQLVIPGDTTSSRFLMHPLAQDAGGDPYHAGGRQFTSQDDPDWMTMAEWVRTGSAGATTSQATSAPAAVSSLDFQVYKTRIEPIFLKQREEGVRCYDCHSVMNTRLRLQALSPGSASWTEEQSRLNFETVSKLVTPGDPLKSRLLLHPLAPEAGGDSFHTGGKFWKSQKDPEWMSLAEWVRGQ
jgi:hypothetical protein